MEQVLHWGLLQGQEPVRVAVLWGEETSVDNELAKVTDRGLVRRSWVDASEERIWEPSLRICLRQ